MSKLLFISNISKNVGSFSMASISAANECKFEFFYAANWSVADKNQRELDENQYGVKICHIDLRRIPYSFKNIRAYKQLVNLIKNEKIDFIHCNTPIGGVLGRLAGKKCKIKKIIYQAHGFHFYKGAPFINWLIYYPIERWLARYTDAIITINKEDYKVAQKFKLRNNGEIYYIPGVGIDTKMYKLTDVNNNEIRKSLGLSTDDIVLIAMGDLIARKNYVSSIKAIARANNNKLHLIICGNGPQLDSLKNLTRKFMIENQIHFLGFRTDVRKLLAITDIFLFTTYQEGLPRSMIEAMSAGLPCIASKVRGNTDLVEDGIGGFLKNPNDIVGFSKTINKLAADKELRKIMRGNNLESVKKFDIENVKKEMTKIYINEF